MRSRWWLTIVLVALVPVLVLLLVLVPQDQRSAGDADVALFAIGSAVLLGAITGAADCTRGSDSFTADDRGLRTRSRQFGDHEIAWDELLELGWVVPGGYAPGGLAGRRREGGRYEPGGPNIAGWLAQPTGRLLPGHALAELRELCAQHGVVWRDYAAADVM